MLNLMVTKYASHKEHKISCRNAYPNVNPQKKYVNSLAILQNVLKKKQNNQKKYINMFRRVKSIDEEDEFIDSGFEENTGKN